jgi:RHS repeat-associated protein
VKRGNKFTISGDNVTFTTTGEGVEYWTYKYDLLNRLTEVRKNGTIVGEYGYDPEGFRVIKKVYKNGSQTDTIHYVFEGTEPIFEKRISDSRIRSYVYAGLMPVARVDGLIGDTQAKKYWYHTDQVGSVKAVTNQTGAVVWNADYLPFGQQYMKNKLDSEFEEDDLGFTGKGYDSDVGLYYFNARWYDADTGRFISEDPAADPNNPNLYSYCANNPLTNVDPTGLDVGWYGEDNCGGASGYNDGNYTQPSPPTGGPSWQIPGALESKDKNGNPIWIWGQLTNGVFSTNAVMSLCDIVQLLSENLGFVGGIICGLAGDAKTIYMTQHPEAMLGEGAKFFISAFMIGLELAYSSEKEQKEFLQFMVNKLGKDLADEFVNCFVNMKNYKNFSKLSKEEQFRLGQDTYRVVMNIAMVADLAMEGAKLASKVPRLFKKVAPEASKLTFDLQFFATKRDINIVKDSYLKNLGIDAHELKMEVLGRKAKIAEYDIYVDKSTGELMVYKKGGIGEGIPTGEYIK